MLLNSEKAPIGHQLIKCQLVFDVKINDFWQKTRLVAGSNKIDSLATSTYTNVVSCEMVHIAMTVTALMVLDMKLAYKLMYLFSL